ncbi:MAG: alpha/beta fold hydrolase [Nitriliruptorales bacterium]|nr:alpha/beta fold hydrolase [Nitriliruptorales bacterium]
MREGFVETRAGRVHYERGGEGTPLVLLHSNGNSLHEYAPAIPQLAQSFDVIGWDMPGQGDSAPLCNHLTIDDYGDCVVDLLDGLGLARATILGASVGGTINASLGARRADRVTALVFVETQFRTAEWWQQMWTHVERLFAVPAQSPEQVAARFRRVTPELVERLNLDRHKAGGRSMMSVMWAIREFDMAGMVAQINAPSLLLYGSDGPTIQVAEAFQQALPIASMAVIDGCGHFPMLDEPDEFVSVVRAFCAGGGQT